jgi:hypothetical protein
MLLLVLTFPIEAAEPEPRATATLSADGQYDVRIVPDVAWLSAEITVDGNATDVGPQQADVPFEVTGSTAEIGTLSVRIMAVTTDNRGVTWMFEVEPEILPADQPDMSGTQGHKRPRWWPF